MHNSASVTSVTTKRGDATPFVRLITGLVFGNFGVYMATIVPTLILLTFKFIELTPQNVTANFSLCAGIGSFVSIVANYVGGYISDRTRWSFGRRRSWIFIGNLVGAISMVGIGLATSVWAVCLCWSLALTFYYFGIAAVGALVPDQVEESKRGTASGILGIFTPVAIMMGMMLMTAINNLPLAMKFNVLAAVSVVTAIIACCLIKESPQQYGDRRKEKSQSAFFPSPKKYPAFTWGFVTRFLIGVAYSTQTFTALFVIQKFNVPQEQVTGIVSLVTLIQTVFLALSGVLGGMLSDKLRKQKPFVAGAAIVVAIAIFILALAPSLIYVYIANAVLGLGYGAYIAVDIALITRILPDKKNAAKDFGIMNIAGNLPSSIVPTFSSTLVALGGFPLFFGILAVAGLLSAAAVAPIPEMSPEPTD
ncbi:sugar phosphate permease [Paenibacillus cellulosilyticus]|uniref:Sugar phosphate permease n=1 Tax=Paenibacillus cellulosilyticus TaxID=375489 RepID=A0A2V2YQX7_9BACL|nr:MFS transporter [Paenibacillus cellulosilyticus]PWV99446.1 sugar phosphate permease [Paenibacillus cellulosilyticus]QKS44704.1 MFS transporter [Paenibacillus cellulosilyticus]